MRVIFSVFFISALAFSTAQPFQFGNSSPLNSSQAFGNVDRDHEEIEGSYYDQLGQLALEIDAYKQVVKSTLWIASGPYKLPLRFPYALRWDSFSNRYETEAHFQDLNGCVYRANLDFVLYLVSARPELVVTAVYPAHGSPNCVPSGQNVGRLTLVKGTPSEEVLLGSLRYNGGFMVGANVGVTATKYATHFRVAIPAFCNNVEVVSAGTLKGNDFLKATLVNPTTNLFSVNGNTGRHIDAVRLDLNGPVNLQCDIPVYGTFRAAPFTLERG